MLDPAWLVFTAASTNMVRLKRRALRGIRVIALLDCAHVVGTTLAKHIIVMDSDGEDRPSDMLELACFGLDPAASPTVVVAQRANRGRRTVCGMMLRSTVFYFAF